MYRSMTLAAILVATAAVGMQPQPPGQGDITIDAATRGAVIEGALKALDEGYIFPDVAQKMSAAIREHQQAHDYDTMTSGRELAYVLTEHLRAVSHDRHLSIDFFPQGTPPPPPPPETPDRPVEERMRAIAGRRNFGFARAERLPGNIGYLDVRGFPPPQFAGETATAAMTFLAYTESLIVDVRQNGGGSPVMVAFLCSYFVGPQPVHLNDFFSRTGMTSQSWTRADVPGPRYLGKDLYILTSARTFSGAEEFTYDLKYLKRATIVGETTGGGAHTVAGHPINANFGISVPSGRPVNAVTGKDWEGVGVEPDVKVPAAKALDTAHLMALEKLLPTLPDAPGPTLKNEVTETIDTLRGKLKS